jgi:hypothetical protein
MEIGMAEFRLFQVRQPEMGLLKGVAFPGA